MNEMEGTGVIIVLFALRCILPLALTIGIGYLMNRMVDKWEREAAAQQADEKPAPETGPVPAPAPVITAVAKEKRPSIALPCWVTRNCDPARRAACPACQQRDKPCWVARLAAEGVLPATCPTCPVYQQAHA
ncbi:MAG: hypothetical protein KC441_04550 [Anaerolineales bacterium]|nr:hypothetical protein [Anaerolineales bacterium]